MLWEVQTGGNDSYGGAFDPANSSMATDGAATSANTSAPVFTSASYTFIARDVGHWLFIKSGTNWLPGWYQIASVSAGAATLTATVGTCPQYSGNGLGVWTNTAVGCASTASPTGATWSVDYSQSTPITYTDLTLPSSSSVLNSAASPFGKNFVGNVLNITGGAGFTVARFSVNTVTGINGNMSSGSCGTIGSTGGTGYLGGPMLTWGKTSGVTGNSNSIFVKSGTYVLTTASSNVAGGVVSWSSSGSNALPIFWEGYGSCRGDCGTKPILQFPAAGVTSAYGFTASGTYQVVKNVTVDCNSATTSSGFNGSSYNGFFNRLVVTNSTSYGIKLPSGNLGYQVQSCRVTGATGTSCFQADSNAVCFTDCEAYGSSVTGFTTGGTANVFNRCIASALTSAIGFENTGAPGLVYENCTAYSCSDGFKSPAGGNSFYKNCYAEGCSGYGFNISSGNGLVTLVKCGGYNNTSGNYNSANTRPGNIEGFVSVSGGSAFTNAASGDFSLNSTASRGAALRAAGYPGLMPRGTSTGYLDIGAIQHADPAGGGGTAGARLVGPSALVTPGGLL